jgi:signal peptide peptidase SppA
MSKDKKKKYVRTFQHMSATPWAIEENKLREIQLFLARKMSVSALDDAAIIQSGLFEAKGKPSATTAGDIAVLNIFGVISQRMDMMTQISGGTSTEKFGKDLKAAVDNPSVKAIVLNVDSPGGNVFGVQELADEIFKARDKKHIVAISNSMCASAAYWLASQCDELVCTPGGCVGSIGVYTIHEDWSKAMEDAGVKSTIIQAGKYKTEGIDLIPLSEEAQAAMQADVDFYYGLFTEAVARGRGVSKSEVLKSYGQGRMLNSKDAKAAGMVDRVDTLDGVLSRLGVSNTAQVARAMHSETAERELNLLLK